MAKTSKEITMLKVYYDSIGNTLSVWFDNPEKEYISEETGDEVILNKDKSGKVIGFEKLNFQSSPGDLPASLPIEVMTR